MLYKLDISKARDTLIEKAFRDSMNDLKKFYGINWIKNIPRILLVQDRFSIDVFFGEKTEPWIVGWADKRYRLIYVLDRKNLETESSHTYTKESYIALIKHELSHLFYGIHSKKKQGPAWLSEGVALYTAGQNEMRTKPHKFKVFLSFYNEGGAPVYGEAGFVIELLVKRYGKRKLLRLLKSLQNISSEKQFNESFHKIYGFQMSYKKMNELLSEK
jgi:hypothetical protein